MKAVALFSISDTFARNTDSKFGALVGTASNDELTVTTTVDIKHNSNGHVDFAYLQKRLAMISAVSASAQLLGLFSTEDADFDDILLQFQHEQSPPSFYLIANKELTQLKCYDARTKEPLTMTIRPGEAEEIATATLHNHANYSNGATELAQSNEESLLLSLLQLETLMKSLLEQQATNPETDRKIVYLANLLAGYRQTTDATNYELLTSKISLLTNETSVITGLENQLARRLFGQQAKPYFGHPQRETTLLKHFLLT